jgi:hypothetical protein
MSFGQKLNEILGGPQISARPQSPPQAPAPPAQAQPAANFGKKLKWVERRTRRARADAGIASPGAVNPPTRNPRARAAAVAALGVALLLAAGGVGWAAREAWPTFNQATDDAHPSPPMTMASPAGAPVQPASTPPTSSTDPSPEEPQAHVAGDTPALEMKKTAAEAMLKEQISDPHGLIYHDVQTVLGRADSDGDINFCGAVDSHGPMGDYLGYQRFISSPGGAVLERFKTPGEFEQIWHDRCSGTHGPRIWR